MANDNPDWAKVEVGRIATIRGASLNVAPSSSVNFDASFTAPLIYTLNGDVAYFNSLTAGNSIGVVGSPSGSFLKIVDYATPTAGSNNYIYPFTVTWTSAINLAALLPGDTSYQLQVRSGATGTTGVLAITIYCGASF